MLRRPVNGVLLLDKPTNMTSNGALQRVKRLFNAKKAGHTGSLDPIATGMLPLCFGEATKFSQFLLDSNKTYQVIAKLGEQTTTGDREGDITLTRPTSHLTRDGIAASMTQFLGNIEQVPPMFSALKVDGRPLYELARKGIEIERKARQVTIFSLTLTNFEDNLLSFTVHCSKGTYVRSLVEDIAKAIDCCAHVVELRRTQVSSYDQAHMFTLPQIEQILQEQGLSGLDDCLLPVDTAVYEYPLVRLSTDSAFYLQAGQAVRTSFPTNASLLRLETEDGRFLGLGEGMPDGRIKPHRLIMTN